MKTIQKINKQCKIDVFNIINFSRSIIACTLHIASCLLLIAYCILPINSFAQQKIDLKTATEMAIKNNSSLNNERTKTNYANALIQTYKNVPITNFLGDFGQVNSAFFDTRIGISQAIKLPKTYASQKSVFTEEWKASQLNEVIKEADLKRIIAQIFSNYLVQNERLKILQKVDSVYQNLLQKANLRLEKGESNILEKTTFEIQKSSLELQMAQIQSEMNVWLTHLQMLLNIANKVIPVDNFKINKAEVLDSLNIKNHPNLRFLSQNINLAKANTAMEQSKFLPEFLIGYYNGSFRGIGPDEKSYNGFNRFHSMQFGLGMPIFKGYLKEKIKASRINETIAENNLKIEQESLNNQLLTSFEQQKANIKIVADYENVALKNASKINEVALKQLNNGEINYLDYVQLVNQNISLQLNYLEAVRLLNESTIQLNYLLNK
jgi:heavy metal efflux system protein